MEKKMENEMETGGIWQFKEPNLNSVGLGCREYIGVMENEMETIIVYWGYVGFRV